MLIVACLKPKTLAISSLDEHLTREHAKYLQLDPYVVSLWNEEEEERYKPRSNAYTAPHSYRLQGVDTINCAVTQRKKKQNRAAVKHYFHCDCESNVWNRYVLSILNSDWFTWFTRLNIGWDQCRNVAHKSSWFRFDSMTHFVYHRNKSSQWHNFIWFKTDENSYKIHSLATPNTHINSLLRQNKKDIDFFFLFRFSVWYVQRNKI